MKIIFLLVLFLLTAGNRMAEAQGRRLAADTTLARKWYQQALTFKEKGSPDSAQMFFQKAATIYQKNKLWNQQINCSNEITRILLVRGKYEVALQNAVLALQESQTKLKKENPTVANALHVMGAVHYFRGNYNLAMEFYQKALQLRLTLFGDAHPSVSSSYNNIGIIYYRKGDFAQALEYFHKDLQVCLKTAGTNRQSIGASYGNIGNVYLDKGDYEQALTYTQKALQMKQEALGDSHPDLANTYNSLSNIYSFKGESDKALEYLYKALHLWQQALGDKHPNVAAAYNNIGSIYEERGEYEKATEYYQKNLQILLQSSGENHPDLASVYHNMGTIFTKQKNFEQALHYLQKAWHLRRKSLGELHDDVAESNYGIGDVYYAQGEYDKALEYYQTNLQIVLQSLGEKNPGLAAAHNALGAAYLAKQNYTTALRHYQQAIVANTISFNDTLLTANPVFARQATIYLDGSYLLTSLQSKAGILEKQFTRSQAMPDLQLAYQSYCTADSLIAQIQQAFSRENDKVAFSQRTRQVYQAALPVCLKLHQLTKKQDYLDKAFYFAERGKAMVLAATLAESKAKTFAGIADSLLRQDQQLRTQIAAYSQQVAQLTNNETLDSTKFSEYQTLLFAAHRQQEQLISKLEKNYPQYYHLKYQPATVTSAQLQKTLDEKTALLEYVVSDTLLHIFTLTRQTCKVQTLSLDASFHRKIAAFRKAILSQEEDLYNQAAYSLYQTLLPAALLKSIQQLIIIPEGELTNLPFEALLTSSKKMKAGQNKSYLLNKFAISYAYSGRLLYERLTQSQENSTKKLLALAPIFADTPTNTALALNRSVLVRHQPNLVNNSFVATNKASSDPVNLADKEILRGRLLNGQYVSPLLASKREVETIAHLFQQQGNMATIFLEGQAREEQFKSNDIANYSYLHLATHGFVNESCPELSGLLLAQDSTSKEDGILYMGEIYNLQLKADLVTLSACETGLGKLATGEGVIGLTRAFLYAGARNIVVSFWKVPDESTADLMANFYAALFSGETKAQALQTAKRKMAQEGKYKHPFYWAPFVLVGK